MARLLKIFKHIGNYSIAALLINHYKKLHPLVGGVFGYGESGMGHGKEVAFFPMPQGLGGATSTTHSRELSLPPISMKCC
ncbi:MAG: hypothetical protein V7L05_02855 [Nostoc sp.]|uniref:hypothetical protein n=1 Tax=Nostoc sp. TaxID=1180 RepID=UPI002FF48F0D